MARNAEPSKEAKKEPAPRKSSKRTAVTERSSQVNRAADAVYGAAADLVLHLSTLAFHARAMKQRSNPDYRSLGPTFGLAMTVQHDLALLVTPEVQLAARSVYSVGSPPPRIGKLPQSHSLLELVRDELGLRLRNSVYQDRRTPLDADVANTVQRAKALRPVGYGELMPDLLKSERQAARARAGVKSVGDAMVLFAREWESLSDEQRSYAVRVFEFRWIDFDELKVKLGLEAMSAIGAMTTHPSARSRVEPDEPESEFPRDTREELNVFKPGWWFEQACHEYYHGLGKPLTSRMLRDEHRSRGGLAQRANASSNLEYWVPAVISCDRFAAFREALITAIDSSFQGQARGWRKDESPPQ